MTTAMNEKVTRNPIRVKVLAISKDGKTAKVQIPRIVPDKIYGKRLYAHTVVFADCSNQENLALNSEVEILPCRRLSKNKTWKIIRGAL